MNRKGVIIRLISVAAIAAMFAQSVFAFPSDVDDVPIKDMTAGESTAGTFSDDNVKRAFDILKYIGTITESEEEFEEDTPVSRGYAASAFAALVSGGPTPSKQTTFTDVPDSNPYASGIQQAVDRGLVDTDSDKFYPNRNASVEDIAVMAVRALKQDYFAYKKSLLTAAMDLDLFKNVTYSQDMITKGQFMIVLENVLKSDFVTIVGIDQNGNCQFEINEDENYMNNVYNIYLQEGILTGYKYSSIYGDLDLTSDKIQINRATFYTDDTVSMDYVGSYINAYVDRENENKVVALWQNSRETSTYSINRADFDTITATDIRYYQGSGRMRVRVNEQVPFIYNNVYYGSYTEDVAENILPECDRIVVTDNDGDGIGDVVKGEKYTHYLIKNVSVMKESIVFKNDGGTLDIIDSSTVEFIYNNTLMESIESLKADDILTVLEAERIDKSKVFIATVTRDMAEGTITSYAENDIGEYYIVDGETYYLSDEYIRYMESGTQQKPKAGTYVQLYIGADLKIVASKTEDDFSYGYIMSLIYDESEEFVRLKVYTTEGSAKAYYFADKVKLYNEDNLEGKRYDKKEAYNLYLNEGTSVNDVVAYTLNSEGLVTSIVKPINRTAYAHGSISYPLTLDYDGTGQNPRMYRNVFNQKYKMDNTVSIMVRPSDENLIGDEKAYEMRTGNYWSVEHYFNGENIKLYNCSEFYVPGFCIMEGVSSTDLSQGEGRVHMYCIDEISNVLDEDDMPIVQISYYENGNLQTSAISDDVVFVDAGLFCDVDSVEELQKGDIIQFDKNSLGKINIIRVFFSIQDRPDTYGAYRYSGKVTSGGKEYIEPSEDALGGMESLDLIYAKVVDIESNVALVNSSKSGTDAKHIYPVTIGHSVYGSVYYNIYDTKAKKVTVGSLSEIQAGDEVVMRRYYNHVMDVVIIR